MKLKFSIPEFHQFHGDAIDLPSSVKHLSKSKPTRTNDICELPSLIVFFLLKIYKTYVYR